MESDILKVALIPVGWWFIHLLIISPVKFLLQRFIPEGRIKTKLFKEY